MEKNYSFEKYIKRNEGGKRGTKSKVYLHVSE